MIGVPGFIDETGGMTRPSVSISSSSIHSNCFSWGWVSSKVTFSAGSRLRSVDS